MTKKKKNIVRTQVLERRNRLHDEAVQYHSKQICEQLYQIIKGRGVQKLHSYLPMGKEVDIFPLLEQLIKDGVELYAPKTLKSRKLEHYRCHQLNELEKGIFGTMHPKSTEEYKGTFDMVIVPALAFDQKGNRIGYGAGYYDTFLEQHPHAYKVGVAYFFQMFEHLEVEAHDIPMDEVVSSRV